MPQRSIQKNKGKDRKKDEENDVGKGNNGSFSFNTERDIMSQDNEMNLWKNCKERNEDERKVNKQKAPDKMDKMDECNTSEEQMCENEEECSKKQIIFTIINALRGGHLVVILGKEILMIRMKWMGIEEIEMTGRWIVQEKMMKILCSLQTRLWPLPVQTQGMQLLKVFIQLYYNNSHQQYENEVSHSSLFKISMFISHKSAFESKDTKIDSNSQMHKNRQTCRYICI